MLLKFFTNRSKKRTGLPIYQVKDIAIRWMKGCIVWLEISAITDNLTPEVGACNFVRGANLRQTFKAYIYFLNSKLKAPITGTVFNTDTVTLFKYKNKLSYE